MSTSAPIPTLAHGMRKQFPHALLSVMEETISYQHFQMPILTRSKKVNLKRLVGYFAKLHRGLTLDHVRTYDKNDKWRCGHSITALLPTRNMDKLLITDTFIPEADPMKYNTIKLDIELTNHAIERLFQRHAGINFTDAMRQISKVVNAYMYVGKTGSNKQMHEQEGKYEIGTGEGMAIVQSYIGGRVPQWHMLTWVHKSQLRPDQSAETGVIRKI